MRPTYACGTPEHFIARRKFLGGIAAAGMGSIVGGLGVFARPATAIEVARQQKRVVVFNMNGGLSQLESWDPKPGTTTGGPFRAIPTSVPGIHVSELLPMTAKQVHHLCLVRGVNTAEDEHGKALYLMSTGRRQTPAADYPRLGAVAAKALTPPDSPLPSHIHITPGGYGGSGNDSAYLEPKFASVTLGNGDPPQHTLRPGEITEQADQSRNEFRRRANERFLLRRRTASTDAYASSYEQALQLMQQRDVFDISKEPDKDIDRYGKYEFARHCVLARRLLEKGIPFVKVTHSNYDTHSENFDFHLEQLGEFDQGFSNFVADIADRGMLDSTLIVVLSEFGRSPAINQFYGRDHWSKAWSIVMGGCRTPRGHVFGSTNADGTEVVDGQVDHGDLFHTFLQSVGVDSTGSFNIDGRELPIADPAAHPIEELLV